jgi:uncharacterized membrane protein
MTHESVGKILIGIGIFVIFVGAIVYLAGGKLGWIGRLPGDISIERENFRFYFPLTTLVLLNLGIWILAKIFQFFQR